MNKQNCLIKFKRNSNIFYNFENLKKTDHCLEMPADWEVSILWILIQELYLVSLKMNAANFTNIKDNLKLVFQLSCFVGHPVSEKYS